MIQFYGFLYLKTNLFSSAALSPCISSRLSFLVFFDFLLLFSGLLAETISIRLIVSLSPAFSWRNVSTISFDSFNERFI